MARTRRVLILAGENPFGQEVMTGILAYCRAHGEWEFHTEVYRGETTLKRCRFAVKHWKAHGIIALVRTRAMERFVRQFHLPVVNFSGVLRTSLPTVISDSVAAGRMAAQHFIDSGSRNFAYFSLTSEISSRLRAQGFVQRLTEVGYRCAIFTDVVAGADELDWVKNRRRMDRWMLSLPKPVSILCNFDVRGQEISWTCRRLGLRVPDDVALVGVGNDEVLCEMCSPPLSSVDTDSPRIGYEAARLLDSMLKGNKPPIAPILVTPRELAARQSSDIVAIEDGDVASAVRFIRDHVREPMSVKDLLRQVPISRRALEKRFEKAIGRSPKAEILRARMDRAKTFLSKTELPMSMIAKETGFVGQEKFSATFRRECGVTATAYRRSCRSIQTPAVEPMLARQNHRKTSSSAPRRR